MQIPESLLKKFLETRRESLGRKYYYENNLSLSRKYNRSLENLLVLFTSGTFLSLKLWDYLGWEDVKTLLTPVFGAIAAILSYIKLILKPSQRIEKYSKLYEIYFNIVEDFNEIEFEIQSNIDYGINEFKESYGAANRRKRDLVKDDDLQVDEKINIYYKARVYQELPEDSWKIGFISPEEKLSSRNNIK